MKKTLPILFSPILLLFSCEKEIPFDPEETEPRIVVNGLVSAGDPILLRISESRDVLYEDPLPYLENAEVTLYDASDNVLATFTDNGLGHYDLPAFTPVAGSTYKITATASGFEAVSSTTSVPSIVSILQVDTIRKNDNMEYAIQFSDDAAQTNYYAISVVKHFSWTDPGSGDTSVYSDQYACTNDAYVKNGYVDPDGQRCNTVFLFSDESFNGLTKTFTCSQSVFPVDSTVVVINLQSLSEDYYKYLLTREKYWETSGSPFAQPVQVYSNIENGFGIFGGYSTYTDTLKF